MEGTPGIGGVAKPKRLRRDEARKRTRDELIRAASRVFGVRGFHGATLDEVAAAAGVTTGAIYSNFDGKEDLFLAVLEDRVARQIRGMQDAIIAGGVSPHEKIRQLADRWMEPLKKRAPVFPLFVEFWTYSARRPALRERYAARLRSLRDAMTRMIDESFPEITVETERMAIIVQALATGLAMEKLADPDGVPDDLMQEAIEILLAGSEKKGE